MRKTGILILLLLLSVTYSQAQTKRALIIAIGNYPNPAVNRWIVINAVNDLPLIKNALIRQHFLPENIDTLVDAQATKQGIIDAFDRLIAKSGKGDIVVIHVSSHGEQIEDDNGDEVDGLDECIVPYGAVFSRKPELFKKLADGYFRDDLFGEKITLLRNKLGKKGDILVSIDACHSGSGTRGGGTAVIRGNMSPMVSAEFDSTKLLLKDTAGVFKDNNNATLSDDAATYVVISASQAQELNAECYNDQKDPVGSLSYSISKALTTLTGKITYRSLFAHVEDIMRSKVPTQKPVLEGDGIDRELFGGNYRRQEPYFTVNMDSSNSQSVVINAGTVSGVTVGSVVGFYPGGTNNPATARPLRKGTVVAANSFSAAVKLETEDDSLLNKIPWAFVTELKYGNDNIVLGTDSLTKDAAGQVKAGLKDFQLAKFSPDCELYFTPSASGNGLSLKLPVSGDLFADALDINNPKSIMTALKQFFRYRFLRDLTYTEDGLSAKIELLLLDSRGNIDSARMAQRAKFGRLELKIDDIITVRVTNSGTKPFYFNIIDISPDGGIAAVIPDKNLRDSNNQPTPVYAEECFLDTGKVFFRPGIKMRIGTPLGGETLKIFLSDNSLDLQSMLSTNNTPRGALNDLQKIFRDAEVDDMGSRGGGGKINTDQNGTIFNVNFTIVPK